MPRCRCRCRRRRRQTLKTSVIISAPLFVRSIASHSNGQDRTSPTLDTCTRIHPPTRVLYSARLAHLCSKLRRLRRCSSLKGERRKAAATADMAERAEESTPKAERESIREKILEKIHDHSSSSSDSDDDKVKPSSSVKSRISHLFGREKPVHQVFGGGKPADVFLWRNKKTSAGVLGVATAIWILFEILEYHLLTLVSHVLIFTLAILFLWSNATTFINKSPPHIPEVSIPEDQAVNIALSLRHDINKSFAVLRDIVTGRDLKKFLAVIAGLWILSIIGGSVSFLTLFYAVFVLLHTIPVLYEKYEDKVDFYWDKAVVELKKHYNAVYAKVANKIPSAAQLKAKKHQ